MRTELHSLADTVAARAAKLFDDATPSHMPDSIDDLARRWKAQPDAAGAITLCDAIRQSAPGSRAALIAEVGKLATERHPEDASVLLSVARLYAAVERLSDAQVVLISAGRTAPRDAGVFRLLGEVLLRRGDAERAEKVLQRAKQLGANDPETMMWIDRAKVFKPVQAKGGARAVAIEVKNTAIHPVTPHPGMLRPSRERSDSIGEDSVTSVRANPAPWEPSEAETKKAAVMPTGATVMRQVPELRAQSRKPVPPDPTDDPTRHPTGPMIAAQKYEAQVAANTRAVTGPIERVPPPTYSQPDISLVEPAPPAPPRRFEQPSLTDERTEISTGQPVFTNGAAARAPAAAPAGIPTPREVLDALANAGVFEARDAGVVAWDRPTAKSRKRMSIGLGVALVLFVGGAVGVYHEVVRRRAIAHDQAETALAKVEADLDASRASLLPAIEQNIGRAFELDSRSPRAAVDWLEERTMKGLLEGGADLAFEDAIGRAVEVKVPEEKIAFARVSAFIFQGDTGGAAGVMPKWDGPAASQALYQLVTGATLDHAGDPHAIDRYLAASKLAPTLVIADVLLTRAMAIDGDPAKAADLAKLFRTKYPDRPEGAALVALAWARDPARGEQPPPDVAEAIAHASELPLPLAAIPHGLQAIASIDKHAVPDAMAEIEKGLSAADDPGIATWLGSLALETRDEPLVRKAALLAVTFSAVYAPARVLAARIALLAGRFDDALKATEDLDPTSPDVAIVRAATAYERADADGTGRALEAVSADARKLPVFTALNLAPDVLLGRESALFPKREAAARLRDMSSDEAPWSDLIAMDAALDLGLTDVADTILADWKGTQEKPLKAVRASRLARYEDRIDQADHFSKVALETGTVTPRMLIERVMVLVAKNRAAEVGPLLARYPVVLGPSSAWLSAYALASTNKLEEARGRTGQLDVPPALAPAAFRVMAAVSLAAMKDKKRAEPAIKDLLATGSADPDLLAAAVSIGLKVPGPGAKAPPAAPRSGPRRR